MLEKLVSHSNLADYYPMMLDLTLNLNMDFGTLLFWSIGHLAILKKIC